MKRMQIFLTLSMTLAIAVGATFAGGTVRDFTLQLGGMRFDPLQDVPQIAEGWDRASAVDADLHLVQYDGPIPADAEQVLRAAGMEPVQYVHPSTYIVWGKRSDRGIVEGRPAVRWTGDFAPAFRVLPRWRDLSEESVEVRVLIYRGAGPDAVVERIETLGGAPGARRIVNENLEVVGFVLPGDLLQAVATIPGVYSVQVRSDDGGSRAEAAAQISAGNVDGSNLALPGYPAWLTGVGLNGNGVVVAVVDEGIDEAHPDVLQRMLPCVGDTCSSTRSWHGTHTAAIVAGDAASTEQDAAGFLRGQGLAPGAGVVEQVWLATYNQPGGMLALMTDSYTNGALISNNSWGSSAIARGYDIDTLLVDAGVRDADPGTPGSQPLIYVQAINNGNGGTSTQGTPDDGKNIFTIGSTPALDAPASPDSDINSLSSNSAHGPTLDGRTIPHMVAPGCYVDSAMAETPQGFGHQPQCGTSMAAAHVSGAVALFSERYRGVFAGADPSPALVKAAFMAVTHDLEGFKDADGVAMGHRPDAKQGWGRLDLAAVIDPADAVLYFDQTELFDFSGQEWMRVVTPANPAAPMRIMLVWTDAPGHGLGGATPAWNNDLDLSVDAGGQTYLGNQIGVDGFSTTGGSSDFMNNAEGVFLQTVAGNATIRVAAMNINSDAVPFVGDGTDQDFALACYNCALVPDFALAVDPTTMDVCAPIDGAAAVEVEALAGFGSSVNLTINGVPAGTGASFDVNPVVPANSSTLTVDPGTTSDGDYTLDLQGDSATLSRTASLQLRLRTVAPATALLTSPVDGALDVAPLPVLSWDPVPWTDGYLVELATDAGLLDIVYSAVESTTSHAVAYALDQQTTYHWRVRSRNACGYGSFSAVSSLTTADVADLLLVDDDYDVPDEQGKYTTVLNGMGVSYDVWDVWSLAHQGEEPDLATLNLYDRVIWYSALEEIYPGPSDDSESILPTWLDGGGCLLISSIDYVLQQGGVSDFMQQRLGVASVSEDSGQSTVTGQGPVFGGLGPYNVVTASPDYRDSITPDATAGLAFAGDQGDAGIYKDGGWYRTSYLGFGLESIDVNPATQTLQAFLNWCSGLAAVDGDSDGVPNGSDCAPGDAGVSSAPSPITDLLLSKGNVGFSWSQPVNGGGAAYDVLRSVDPLDFYNATCAAGATADLSAPEDQDPDPGEVYFYLVGAISECGISGLGQNFDGTPRYGTACEGETTWW